MLLKVFGKVGVDCCTRTQVDNAMTGCQVGKQSAQQDDDKRQVQRNDRWTVYPSLDKEEYGSCG